MPFRIVPGITACIGGMTYAGFPLTHHDADEQLPPHDWKALAKGPPTLVLHMARKLAGAIADARIVARLNPH